MTAQEIIKEVKSRLKKGRDMRFWVKGGNYKIKEIITDFGIILKTDQGSFNIDPNDISQFYDFTDPNKPEPILKLTQSN